MDGKRHDEGRIMPKILTKNILRVATSTDREAYKHDLPGF